MQQKVKSLRIAKGWNQEQLAAAINDVLETHPDLKKITKRNRSGTVDQQTAQRLETGKISLDERWLAILSLVFGVTPNEILGTAPPALIQDLSPEEREILIFRRGLGEKAREKFDYAVEIQKKLLRNHEDK